MIKLKSILTSPECGFRKEETMPENSCQFFYECENCKTILKPKYKDCCVYCSYVAVKCPSQKRGKIVDVEDENQRMVTLWNGLLVMGLIRSINEIKMCLLHPEH